MTPFAAHTLAHVFADAVPVKVTGDVEYLINRTANGWIVTLLNNNGVFKPQQGMAQVDRSAYVTATITLPQKQITAGSVNRLLNRQWQDHYSNSTGWPRHCRNPLTRINADG